MSDAPETLQSLLQKAVAAHGAAGRHGEAETLYRAVLDRDPNHSTAFYLLGVPALQLGQPAVTLRGRSAIGTLGSSMLTQIGRTDWIAETVDQYVEIAARLASDIPALAVLRHEIRAEIESSPLMDYPGYARDFEAALREMWHLWCRESS